MAYRAQMPSAKKVRIQLQANVFLRARSRPRVVGASERLELGAGRANRGRASCASNLALVRGDSKSARSQCSRTASRDPRLDAPDCARTPRLLHSLGTHVFTSFFVCFGWRYLGLLVLTLKSVPAVRVKSVFAEAGLCGALGGPKCAAPVLRVRSWCGQYEGLHAVPGAEPKLDAPLGISPADTPQTLSTGRLHWPPG